MSAAPLLPVDDAIARIGSAIVPLATEQVSVSDAGGRVLAEPLTARRTHPPFDGSAMDGYAVRQTDAVDVPARLTVVGESAAGGSFDGTLGAKEAVRIFTGAPLPAGADTIVIQEDTERDGDTVIVKEAPKPDQHIRRAGIDFTEGEQFFKAGRRLSASDVALAAAMNIPDLSVFKKPRVAFFATGDELVLPGETPGPNQIVSSNSPGLSALIKELGGIPVDLGIARDNEASIRACAERAAEADILVTVGGASVGDHDLVQPVLTSLGLSVDFWRIAMRPGKPLMFGDFNGTPFLGLPGNPVSALVCGHLFLQAAIAARQGAKAAHPALVPVTLATGLRENDKRQDYLRATLEIVNGAWTATPLNRQDSSMLSALSRSHCLLVRPPHAPAAESGDACPAVLLRAPDLSTD
ncbi:MAG: molybdopterin molybdotransferase MoeA [Rhodobiaceae bacterium]|nr:molybdopterin molybdotransferase MoeA [Rhodobiaceae bacterium]